MLSVLFLSAVLAQGDSWNLPEHPVPSWSPAPPPSYPPQYLEPVELKPDHGSFQFWFGKQNTWAFQSFHLINTKPVVVTAFDCFSVGDIFNIYDNGSFINAVNGFCYGPSVNSPSWNDDAAYCYANPNTWCSTTPALLMPGFHNLTILIERSPQGYGSGFLVAFEYCFEIQAACCKKDNSCYTGRAIDYERNRSNFADQF